MTNPYRWDFDDPRHIVSRSSFVDGVTTHLRDGRAVKLIGGRGMGKSVALRLIERNFQGDVGTRVVRISGPPEEPTLRAAVGKVAAKLRLPPPTDSSLDALMDTLEEQGTHRLILLLDEVDQYVLLDSGGAFAKQWLNRLETLRRDWRDRFTVLVAGGVGLLHVSHVLGSGLLSRAEECVMRTFSREELQELCEPIRTRGVEFDPLSFEVFRTLSGSNPALATYGLAKLWDAGVATRELVEQIYAAFPERHQDFVRAVHDGVSRRGMVGAPGRVLELLRLQSGAVPQSILRSACAGDEPPVDVSQALKVLMAAGLVDVDGMTSTDPVHARLVASVLNLPTSVPAGATPVAGVLAIVAATLGQLHRFGRDFHGRNGLLEEQVFSSLLAVALALTGWQKFKPTREPVQGAGFPDLLVEPRNGAPGHVVIETKIWGRNKYDEIQRQIDDYRVSDTLAGIAVMVGARDVAGWADEYRTKCLPEHGVVTRPTPPDVVAHWRVERQSADGKVHQTDHFLVQIPKRA